MSLATVNWHVLALLVTAFIGGYLVRSTLAWQQLVQAKADCKERLEVRSVALLLWLSYRYHFDKRNAARLVANSHPYLGEVFERAFGICWNEKLQRWYVPRGPRKPKVELDEGGEMDV